MMTDYSKILDQLSDLYPDKTPEEAIVLFIADCKSGKYGEAGIKAAKRF